MIPHRVHVVPHFVEMQIGRVPEAMTQLSAGDHGGWDEGQNEEKMKKASSRRISLVTLCYESS